jgi:hypothetical protein
MALLAPDPAALPERHPRPPPQATSPSRSSPRGRSPELYKQLVAGLVLATAKEVFAVAPAITEIRIVALRGTPADPYGKIHSVSMLAAQIPRAALNGVQWTKVDALSIVDKISSELSRALLVQARHSRNRI